MQDNFKQSFVCGVFRCILGTSQLCEAQLLCAMICKKCNVRKICYVSGFSQMGEALGVFIMSFLETVASSRARDS